MNTYKKYIQFYESYNLDEYELTPKRLDSEDAIIFDRAFNNIDEIKALMMADKNNSFVNCSFKGLDLSGDSNKVSWLLLKEFTS